MMSWEVPSVNVGDTVHYYPHEGAEPVMAFVTKVGKDTLELWALSPGYGGVERPSVRHKEDPRLADSTQWKAFGVWEHRPRDPRFAQLFERLSALEAAVKGNKK
jgi:hypothetical protein